MAWHNWAANDTTQITTLPSVYANVSDVNLATLNGVLSAEHGNTWQPYTYKARKEVSTLSMKMHFIYIYARVDTPIY